MNIHTLYGALAVALMLSFVYFIAAGKKSAFKRGWIFPATVSALFLAFTLYTIVLEGPFGFWTEHVRNFWGNQIWFDLLIAASIGWYFIVPKAKDLNMNILVWMVLVVSSGCIGLTAMLARLLYLQEQSGVAIS